MKYILTLSSIFLFSAFQPAFASSVKPAVTPPPPHSVKNAQQEDAATLSGRVVETMNSGGYTYVCLEKNGEKTWAAVLEMKVSVGQDLTLLHGKEMTNFTSKTLGRTFDKIIFSQGVAAPRGESGLKAPGGPGSKSAVIATKETISVEKAAGPNAYTVAELYAHRGRLNKKTVTVRGKVVKVTANIMGKNWIHIQDGSGDPKKGTHNLVVTSQDLPSAGDVVTVSGTLYKNKDYGSGYYYKVIVEKARVTH